MADLPLNRDWALGSIYFRAYEIMPEYDWLGFHPPINEIAKIQQVTTKKRFGEHRLS